MFTSRCTTPRRVRWPNPDKLHSSGDHRRRDFSFPDAPLQLQLDSPVLPDPMTAFTRFPIARPRHAGRHRLAASWRAPVGAFGSGMRTSAGVAGVECGMRLRQPGDRKQQTIEVNHGRTGELGYRALDAGYSGAGSGFQGDAP